MQFTDEHLCQLIDGELSPREEAQLRELMSIDESLAERFAYLALADARLKSSVSAIDDTPIPKSILTLLADDHTVISANAPIGRSPLTKTFWQRLGGVMIKPVAPYPAMAMAFTFLLVGVLTFMGWQTSEFENRLTAQNHLKATQYGVLELNHPVSEILSNAPSGSPQELVDQSEIVVTPVLSFASTNGDFCREYTLSDHSAFHRAVACRQNSGWRVVLSTEAGLELGADQYQTASVITPGIFERRINEIIDGDPLSYQQELLLIEQGWKPEQ